MSQRKINKIFLYVVHEVFVEVSLFQEICSAPKNSWLRVFNFQLNFNPNFHPNILVFSNLPIYRKTIHDNISLMFWKLIIFYLVLFWRRYRIFFAHYRNVRITETLVGVILKKIYIIFIYKYWHYNLC